MGRKGGSKNIFGFEGSFINVFDKIFDVLALGFLWILCSIPVVTVGASTTALYYAMVKSVKNHKGYIAKEFFRSFKENLATSTLLWILAAAVSFALHLNIGILAAKTNGYVGLFFICLYAAASVYIFMMLCYAFPALSRFDMGTGWIIKISGYMVVRYFGTTLALALMLVSAGILVFKIPMLVFFIPGPLAFIASDFLERVLKQHEPEDYVPFEQN